MYQSLSDFISLVNQPLPTRIVLKYSCAQAADLKFTGADAEFWVKFWNKSASTYLQFYTFELLFIR